jgi:hypothetical protein
MSNERPIWSNSKALRAAVRRTISRLPNDARNFAHEKVWFFHFNPAEPNFTLPVVAPERWTVGVSNSLAEDKTEESIARGLAHAYLGMTSGEGQERAQELCKQWGFA